MDENKTSIPKLTLEPNMAEAMAAVQALEEPAKKEEKVELPPPEKLTLERLSPEEQAAVKEFSSQIDVMNTEQVINYGAAAQANISEFSDAALKTVRAKDLGEVGEMLAGLSTQLKGIELNEDDKKRLFGFLKKKAMSLEQLKNQYTSAEANVDRIVESLEKHEVTLMKDVALMDGLHKRNEEYLKELSMYIIAGKLRIEQLRNEELPKLKEKAEKSGLPEDAQEANDFANMIGRFEKKIHDLELTRTIAIQMAPQIRMIQNNDSMMVEKIRSSINNTIPLWKNQMVLGMSMYNSQKAMEAQREVSDTTNKLLEMNAKALHQGSVEIAQETERGIVDLETLKKANKELIDSIDEIRSIQDTGRKARKEAEEELAIIEGELKAKLLEMAQ